MKQKRDHDLAPAAATQEYGCPRASFLGLPASIRKRIYAELGLIPKPGDQPWGPMTMDLGCIAVRNRCEFGEDEELSPFVMTSPSSYYCRCDGTDHFNDVIRKGERPWGQFCVCGPFPADLVWCHRCLLLAGGDYRSPIVNGVWLFDCECDDFVPTELFRVCRLVSAESRALFYSQTKLQLVYTPAVGFGIIQALQPDAIACLSDLTVRMNLCFCPDGPDCRRSSHTLDCHPSCKRVGHDAPLGLRGPPGRGSRFDTYLLNHLRWLCRRLAAHIMPGRLRLTFICESRDYGLAAEAMRHLSQLPTLRSCSIALGQTPSQPLCDLAERTRLRLLGYPESRITNPFPLRRLPRELQLAVLQQTELVAPHRAIFSPHVDRPLAVGFKRSRTATRSPYDLDGLDPFWAAHSRLCCCSSPTSNHSWMPCACHSFPSALFLVDRQMRADALDMVYRENAWVLTWRTVGRALGRASDGGRLARFLGGPAREVMLDLRHLAMGRLRSPGNEFGAILRDLFALIAAPRQLRLALGLPRPPFSPQPLKDTYDTNGKRRPALWRGHYIIVEELVNAIAAERHRRSGDVDDDGDGEDSFGFRDIFIWIDEPLPESDDSMSEDLPRCHPGNLRDREIDLEKVVMGAEYDSQARGKDRSRLYQGDDSDT